uniref:Ima1 N-terminal domain-containing protein n=1 Tax=Timema shepardi TaxID=629360 RepID=A0A7R9APQ6_TIMSH|nr:unnamed protein product [Timema shepardi]
MRWKFGEFCRRRLKVCVNCWYCNENTTVPYENVNCFECPHCDQYNGFSDDGGYNKDIPAQHDELLNHPINAANQTKSLGQISSSKSLCHYCNINQELKIQQLAGFVASRPSKYDQEIEQYREPNAQIMVMGGGSYGYVDENLGYRIPRKLESCG